MSAMMLLLTTSCYHQCILGDRTGGNRQTVIDADRIAELKPGKTIEEVLKIFDSEALWKLSYVNRPLKKKNNGREYTVDYLILFRYIPKTDERLSDSVVRYGWSDRIDLAVFFYKGILQFYTVEHETRAPNGDIIVGSLDTDGAKGDGGPWADSGCDLAHYDYYEWKTEIRWRSDREERKRCGLPLTDP
jgi:hypothetical protein